MVKVPEKKRIKYYYEIYEQIYDNPTINANEISKKTKRSRNTTSKYLREVYERNVFR